MRKVLLSLSLILGTLHAFSQEDSLLKSFKYRINHYRAIGLSFGAGSIVDDQLYSTGKSTAASFSGGAEATLFTVHSTDRLLLSTTNGVSASISRSKNENFSVEQINRNFTFAGAHELNARFYNAKQFFKEVGIGLNENFNRAKVDGKNLDTYDAKADAYGGKLSIGFGKGRLENISDMQNALWLNRALERSGRLSRNLSAAELHSLGRAITKGKNTRVLDSRRQIQYTLQTVDSFLQNAKLVSSTDIRYFTQLNDVLFFAFNQQRFAGTEKFIRLGSNLRSAKERLTSTATIAKTNQDLRGLSLTAGINKYIPQSLRHQNNFGAGIKGVYQDLRANQFLEQSNLVLQDDTSNTSWRTSGTTFFYEHGYFPNTRTAAILGIYGDLGNFNQAGKNNFYKDLELGLNASYFISYRTRFNLYVQGIYRDYVMSEYQSPYLIREKFFLQTSAAITVNL